MNKMFLIAGLLILSGMVFARPPPNVPYFQGGYIKAFCLNSVYFQHMNSTIYGYNQSYNGQLASLLLQLATSRSHMYTDWYNLDYSAFNSEYGNVFMPLVGQLNMLFLRAARDYINAGHGYGTVMNDLATNRDYLFACLASPPA